MLTSDTFISPMLLPFIQIFNLIWFIKAGTYPFVFAGYVWESFNLVKYLMKINYVFSVSNSCVSGGYSWAKRGDFEKHKIKK